MYQCIYSPRYELTSSPELQECVPPIEYSMVQWSLGLYLYVYSEKFAMQCKAECYHPATTAVSLLTQTDRLVVPGYTTVHLIWLHKAVLDC